jgi:hypothetical protein
VAKRAGGGQVEHFDGASSTSTSPAIAPIRWPTSCLARGVPFASSRLSAREHDRRYANVPVLQSRSTAALESVLLTLLAASHAARR